MRRPEVDGWYHVMGRGLERRELFTEDREREHFLDLLAAVHETHGLVIHAYVLMDNHLVVQTPQWLTTEAILVRSGGAELDRQKNYRSYVRRRLAEGGEEATLERLRDGVSVGFSLDEWRWVSRIE